MDDFKREGYRHDASWLGRKWRKGDKARARAAVKRAVSDEPTDPEVHEAEIPDPSCPCEDCRGK